MVVVDVVRNGGLGAFGDVLVLVDGGGVATAVYYGGSGGEGGCHASQAGGSRVLREM